MTKSLSNILKTSSNILSANAGGTGLTSVGNTGNVLTSTGAGWVSSALPTYTLPTANTTTLGGVKIDGTTIVANNGIISANVSSGASATKTISNITGAYTVVAGDLGKIINCTSGTFTVSLTAAASLGAGFTCTIWNTGTGAITIDPNASETIDGVTTLILRQGEGLAIVCNGTNWETDDKKPMRGYAENFYNGIVRPIASGSGSIAFGETASASGTYTIALGLSTTASATGAIAIGSGYNGAVSAGSNYSLAIGTNSGASGSVTATGSGAMALGGSYASGTDSFAAAIGNNTSSYGAQGTQSIAFGYRALSTGNSNGMAMGAYSIAGDTGFATAYGTASGYGAISMGYQSTASANYAVALGTNSAGQGSKAVTGAGAMALGGSYASGTDSFAAAIGNNTNTYGAQGTNNIAIGYQSKATGSLSVSVGLQGAATGAYAVCLVSNGYGSNIASASGSLCLGGGGLTSSGTQSTTIGTYLTASALKSVAIGVAGNAAQTGKYVYSSGSFIQEYNVAGDSQFGKIILRAATTTTTAVALTSDGSAASTTNQLIVATNQAMTFFGTLIAKQSASANMASYMFKGSIVNNGGTVSISSISIDTIVDTIGLGAVPTFTADNTNKALAVTSGYKSATNIRWVCNIDSVEVTYA